MVLEGGTHEVVRCSGALILHSNGSICADIRYMKLRRVSSGRRVNAPVTFPLLEVRGTRAYVKVRNLDAVWRASYGFVDGGFLIPLDRGRWNLTASSDGQIILYEVQSFRPAHGRLVRRAGSVEVSCPGPDPGLGVATVLVYNPSDHPVALRVERGPGPNPALIASSVALVLAAILVGRRLHASEGGRRGGAGKGGRPPI